MTEYDPLAPEDWPHLPLGAEEDAWSELQAEPFRMVLVKTALMIGFIVMCLALFALAGQFVFTDR